MARGYEDPLSAASVLTGTLFCLFGLWVWAAHLALVYIAHHLACRVAFPPVGMIDALIAGITLVLLAVLAAAALKPGWLAALTLSPREELLKPFYVSVMRWIALLGGAGIAWAGASVVFLAACAA